MSYSDLEESVDSSQPVELYEFKGTYRNYYMTSDVLTRMFQSNPYVPVAGLKRGGLKITTHEDNNQDMSITLPINSQIVKDYAFQITPPSLVLTIYRMQRSTGEYVEYWTGPISGISVSGEWATFKAQSKFGAMLAGNIPNVYVQPVCNNVLFDERCKVSRSANSIDTSVVSVDGVTVEIPSIGSFADGWFVGGEIVIATRNERRMIVAQDGVILTVNYEFARLTPGTAIQVTAGCDHSFNGPNGCSKFNNQKNFGGMPYVPGESNNLFQSGVH